MNRIHNCILNIMSIIFFLYIVYIALIPFIVNLIYLKLYDLNFYLLKRKNKRIMKYTHGLDNQKGFLFRNEVKSYLEVEFKIYEHNQEKLKRMRNKIAYWSRGRQND